MTILALLIVFLYMTGIIMFWARIKNVSPDFLKAPIHSKTNLFWKRELLRFNIVILIFLHGLILYRNMMIGSDINLALGHIVSLVGLITVVIYFIGSFRVGVLNLGTIVLPIGLITFMVGQFIPGVNAIIQDAPIILWFHLIIALLAFGVLCMAVAQASLLYLQEKQLHNNQSQSLFPALPAIETMERNLFDLTLIGVLLLTGNLIIGMISAKQIYGFVLVFNHHIFLSFLAWAGFLGLFLGNKLYGWRGVVAAKWTLIAFIVLIFAYFGTRFVTSVILQ